jgi:hypothetical protein
MLGSVAESMNNKTIAVLAVGFWVLTLSNMARPVFAAEIEANPSHYREVLSTLKAGDTMNLAPGRYPRLIVSGLNGSPTAWITIKGPTLGPPAVITGESGYNTVEILNSSFVAIENLRVDSLGIPGAFGISAKGGSRNVTHDILIEGNTLVGQSGNQQTDGISTKTPTWGWIIRNNQILGAGTGVYLGDSDGTQPFVNGLIENNLIKDTIGYNMEIKDQISIPEIQGMPAEPTSTIIRNNVFIKNDWPSPDGNRPNLLVGAFPMAGIGSHNLYEIYGNFFLHNHRDALFQGSGRISLHDNIFVDGPPDYPAVVLRRQNFPLRVAYVYNNTVYTTERGIYFGTPAIDDDAVVGNLVFASAAITGAILHSSGNLAGTLASAPLYVTSPSFNVSSMDFYPRAGKCQGKAIDLRPFKMEADFDRDFNGSPKAQAKRGVVFRGAYAGDGTNPGWRLQAAVKPSSEPPSRMTGAEGRIDPTLGRIGTNFDSLLLILPLRSDDFEIGNATRKKDSTVSAFCRGRKLACCMDGCRPPPADAYAAGLLLWQPAAGSKPAAAERRDRSSVAWPSG